MFEYTFFNGADAVTMFSSKRFSDVAQIALLCFFGYKSRDMNPVERMHTPLSSYVEHCQIASLFANLFGVKVSKIKNISHNSCYNHWSRIVSAPLDNFRLADVWFSTIFIFQMYGFDSMTPDRFSNPPQVLVVFKF